MTHDDQTAGRTGAAIVIPCYNEEKRLPVGLFQDFMRRGHDVHFIFVNDGSSDRTEEILRALRDANPQCCSLHSLPRNSGKAEAVRQGLLAALRGKSGYIGYWDADLSTPLEYILDFLTVLQGDAALHMVSGSRVRLIHHRIERSMVRHYAGRIVATLVGLLFDLPMYDTQCGAKIFRSSPRLAAALEDTFRSRWFFDLELILRLQANGEGMAPTGNRHAGIHEFPLRFWQHRDGSKLSPRDMVRIPFELTRVFFSWRSSGRRRKQNVPHPVR